MAFEVCHILGSWFYVDEYDCRDSCAHGSACCIHAKEIRMLWSLALMAVPWLISLKMRARGNCFHLSLRGQTRIGIWNSPGVIYLLPTNKQEWIILLATIILRSVAKAVLFKIVPICGLPFLHSHVTKCTSGTIRKIGRWKRQTIIQRNIL